MLIKYPSTTVLMGSGTRQISTLMGNLMNAPVRASIIRKGGGKYSYSIEREESELLMRLGVGDKAVVHVRDIERPVAFRAKVMVHGYRLYIHVPKWAMKFYEPGDEAILIITPLEYNTNNRFNIRVTGP